MSDPLARFGVSIEASLLEAFDRLLERKHYTNRSEAIRDLIRNDLVADECATGAAEVIATISILYDHHVRGLSERLVGLQHDCPARVVSAMHIHLDHHNCFEVLVVRGRGEQVDDLARRLRSVRGVRHATLSTTSALALEPPHAP